MLQIGNLSELDSSAPSVFIAAYPDSAFAHICDGKPGSALPWYVAVEKVGS